MKNIILILLLNSYILAGAFGVYDKETKNFCLYKVYKASKPNNSDITLVKTLISTYITAYESALPNIQWSDKKEVEYIVCKNALSNIDKYPNSYPFSYILENELLRIMNKKKVD